MRFASSAVVFMAVASTVTAFQQTAFKPSRISIVVQQSTSATEAEEKRATKKEERLRMMKSDRFHRRGFKEVREGVESNMEDQFQSPIVNSLRTSNFVMDRDGVKVYLAKVRFSHFVVCFFLITNLTHSALLGFWILLGR
jgi:4-hydroxy-3-methylbut-2-enyl diphosphate reductase